MKKILTKTIFLVMAVFIYAWGLRTYTLYLTNGETDFMFQYVCGGLGTGICDGNHNHMEFLENSQK